MIKENLFMNWDALSAQDKKEIANFVSKKMQSGTTQAAKELLAELNDLAGARYKAVTANLSLIQARLSEGHTREEISRVILRKCHEWANNPQMSLYLRPKTLFNATNFNNYVGQLEMKMPEPEKPKLKRPNNDNEWLALAKKVGAGNNATYQDIWSLATVAHDAGRL